MDSEKTVRFAATVSVGVALLLLVVKVVASELTGSLAVWSDAMESIVHIASLAFMWYAVRLAQEPPDKSHPYGHGKVESFSVGIEGALIITAGIAILWSVAHSFLHPRELQRLDVGILLIFGGAAVNTLLGLWLIRTGRRCDSAAIEADGHHIMSDAWTSWGVVAGVLVVKWTGLLWIDKALAVVIALHLCRVGFKLVARSMNRLMDGANPKVIKTVLNAINEKRESEWVDIHALRVHTVGQYHHIDFHLVVPADWTIARAHHISHDLEDHILEKFNGKGSVIVHLDPETDQDVYQTEFTVERALRDDQFDHSSQKLQALQDPEAETEARD